MSPIVEQGSYMGVIARCDVCGETSGYLDDEDAIGYAINDVDGSARQEIDGWLLIFARAGDMHATVYCPHHASASEDQPC